MPPLPRQTCRGASVVAQQLATRGSNALTGLWHALTGGDSAGVKKSTLLGQFFVTLVPALFIVAALGATWRLATAPEARST